VSVEWIQMPQNLAQWWIFIHLFVVYLTTL
jgi:hypothetical protein